MDLSQRKEADASFVHLATQVGRFVLATFTAVVLVIVFAAAKEGPLGEPIITVTPGSPTAAALPERAAISSARRVWLNDMLVSMAHVEVVLDSPRQTLNRMNAVADHAGDTAGKADDAVQDSRPAV